MIAEPRLERRELRLEPLLQRLLLPAVALGQFAKPLDRPTALDQLRDRSIELVLERLDAPRLLVPRPDRKRLPLNAYPTDAVGEGSAEQQDRHRVERARPPRYECEETQSAKRGNAQHEQPQQ